MSNLLASLGHTGRRVVLGHTLSTQALTKTDEQKKVLSELVIFVLGCFHSHPGPCGAHGPWVGHLLCGWLGMFALSSGLRRVTTFPPRSETPAEVRVSLLLVLGFLVCLSPAAGTVEQSSG